MKKKIALLGSTGSIGTQALIVISGHPRQFAAPALAAGGNIQRLAEQVRKFRPALVSVDSAENAARLKKIIPRGIPVFFGSSGLEKISRMAAVDMVLVAIPGIIALSPTITAIKNKKDIAIASKEILVAAGNLIMDLARKNQVRLRPVDSEHSAIFQCLKNEPGKNVKRIILTASGGPFFRRSLAELKEVTVRDALRHPTWNMGRKVTIDSASLMNKGLEVIEAHYLFDLPYEKIEVVIHPESIIHSLVEFVDGSVLAQLSEPDMTLPIQYAFSYPERLVRQHRELNLKTLNFFQPDLKKFPCLRLAFEAGLAGGTMPAAMNAANEIAVAEFLQGRLGFLQIPWVVEKVMNRHQNGPADSLEKILAADELARTAARKIIARYAA